MQKSEVGREDHETVQVKMGRDDMQGEQRPEGSEDVCLWRGTVLAERTASANTCTLPFFFFLEQLGGE